MMPETRIAFTDADLCLIREMAERDFSMEGAVCSVERIGEEPGEAVAIYESGVCQFWRNGCHYMEESLDGATYLKGM